MTQVDNYWKTSSVGHGTACAPWLVTMANQAATFKQATDAVVDVFMVPMDGQLGSERLANVLGTMGWTVDQYENAVRDNGVNSTSHRGGW